MSTAQFTFGLVQKHLKLSVKTQMIKLPSTLKINKMEEMLTMCKLLNLNHSMSQLISELISQSGKMKSVKHGSNLTHMRPR